MKPATVLGKDKREAEIEEKKDTKNNISYVK